MDMPGGLDADSLALTAHSTASSLPGRLGSGVQLTSLSPLTDRRKLCASPGLENVATGLASFGYQVGWDNGYFEVSPADSSPRPRDAPVSVSLDSFMGAQTRKRDTFGYRPRVASSLTFSKPNGGSNIKGTASGYSTGLGTQQIATNTQYRPAVQCSTSPPISPGPSSIPVSTRFSRLAQSVDSLQQLQVPVGGNINGSNLMTLSQPTWNHCMASPTARPATPSFHLSITPPHPDAGTGHDTYSGPSGQNDTHSQPRGDVQPEPGAAASVRPSTAYVDLNKDAGAALRPSTAGPSATRPFTAAARPFTASSRNNSRATSSSHGRSFKLTRGHALVVFQDMDKDKNGKVTLSELEEAALAVGFTLEQSHKMFGKMDKGHKGYLLASDWGDLEVKQIVELFSLVYMQRFLGLPGPTSRPEQVKKYWQMQEVKAVRSMSAAIHMARSNALLRGSHAASNSGNVVFEAFRFIDTDNSGRLSYEELRDGFYALGVFVKDEVMKQMMAYFDTDNDGLVNYYEFVQKMFPNSSARGQR